MSSYQIYEFDGVALPLYNANQDLSTGIVDSPLIASAGGIVDVWPGIQRAPRSTKLSVSGIYASPEGTLMLVDYTGAQIVDHAGNRIYIATAPQHLRQQVDALRAKTGVVGRLWRRRWDDQAVAQWKTARLMSVAERSDRQHRTIMAQVECAFECPMANWRDASADVLTANLSSGGQVGMLLDSSGNATIDDSTLTIAAVGGAISAITIAVPDLGIDLRWTGSLADGRTLTIDCGAQVVRIGSSTGVYSGFSLGPGHTARSWLPLPPGLWAMLVGADGPGTVQSSHFDQWV
jgi:hypothetical protein